MKSFSIYRSSLSNEKIAVLSEIKRVRKLKQEDNTPKTYKRKEKDLDILWQDFKSGTKEEKSPGVYLLTGFIVGALCVFVMNSMLDISSIITAKEKDSLAVEQPKFEKKISRKEKLPQINSTKNTVEEKIEPLENVIPVNETYTVKSGDSMSSIVHKFYGKYDVEKIEKIKQLNNLQSENKLSIGQQLVIPMD